MLCLGRLLKTERTVVASLLNLFVSPSVFLPGACFVPLRAKPRSLVASLGYLGLLFHWPFLPGGHCLSSKLSYVTALL